MKPGWHFGYRQPVGKDRLRRYHTHPVFGALDDRGKSLRRSLTGLRVPRISDLRVRRKPGVPDRVRISGDRITPIVRPAKKQDGTFI